MRPFRKIGFLGLNRLGKDFLRFPYLTSSRFKATKKDN